MALFKEDLEGKELPRWAEILFDEVEKLKEKIRLLEKELYANQK